MGTQSQQHQRATPPWPHVDHESDIKTSLGQETSYLDEDTVTIGHRWRNHKGGKSRLYFALWLSKEGQ